MKVIAHRGASKYCPQNTIPAFRLAVEQGADGIETDVHLTKDGEIVLCHDYTIDATSNGTGDVNEMTLEELRQYDFGSYKGEEFLGTKIPTLEELLEVVKDLEIINIEIKPPRKDLKLIVSKTLEVFERFGLTSKLFLSSFDVDVLLMVKKLNPQVKTGLLYSIREVETPFLQELLDDPFVFASKYSVDAMNPFVMMIGEDFMDEAHEAGFEVYPWTTNTAEAVEALLDIGCDGVITDVPDVARAVIDAQSNCAG